jgi:cytochrome c oxidase subunit 4
MSVHISPTSTYLKVFFALLVLTALTVWVAFFDFGALNDVIALGIALIKATIVVLFFMHVKWGTGLIKLVVASGVVWLLVLFAFTLSDYLTRAMLYVPPPV